MIDTATIGPGTATAMRPPADERQAEALTDLSMQRLIHLEQAPPSDGSRAGC